MGTAGVTNRKEVVGETVKLLDICTIQYGYAFDSNNFTENADNIPLVRIRDVKRGYSETYYSGNYAEEYIVREGDLLVGMDGEFNIARWKSRDSLLNQRVCRIQAQKGTDEEYLRYALVKKLKQIEERTAFVTVKHLSAKELNAMVLEVPPYEEQKIISNQLSKIEELIELRKKQVEHLDTLIKARFVEMFGDPRTNDKGYMTRPGSECFKLSNGKFVPESKRFSEGVPAYGGNGISWYTDDILFANDTIVVGRVGFQSGNVHLVRGPLWITDNAMYISQFFGAEYNLVFLEVLMKHINFTRLQDAGDLKKITQKPFMEMEFIYPPIEKQREYAAFVTQIDKSKFDEFHIHK